MVNEFWCPECKERFSYKGEDNPRHCGVASRRTVKYLPEPPLYYKAEKDFRDKWRKKNATV